MRLIKPSFELMTDISEIAVARHIETAGRTCYKSEDKITMGSSSRFVNSIIKSGHHSVIEHYNFTVKFIVDRGVTHELVRHRLAAYSQESTRYCNYTKGKFGNELTFIIPPWYDIQPCTINRGYFQDNKYKFLHEYGDSLFHWLQFLCDVEIEYNNRIIRFNEKPEQARSVLPNCLKTEIVMTANIREWRHVLNLRCSKAAHPQIREIMSLLLSELNDRMPVFFGDVYEKYIDN